MTDKKEKNRRFYQNRLEKGLCTRCGKKLDRDGAVCVSCLEKKRTNAKIRIDRMKREGRCVTCGMILDREGVMCSFCNDKQNAEARKTREMYIGLGICPRCRKEPLYSNEKLCKECMAKQIANNAKYVGGAKKNRISQKIQYQKLKAEGICVKCKKRKSDKGHATCSICRAKQTTLRRNANRRKGAIPLEERRMNGICIFCNNPVEDGYKVCKVHLEMNREKAAIARKSVNTDKHVWRENNKLIFKKKEEKCSESL